MSGEAVAGIDGWRKGWIVALSPGDGNIELLDLPSINDVLSVTHAIDTIGIDMPMSLPTSGRRSAEEELKAHLGAAGRSIFYSPTKAALSCSDRARADERNRAAGGGGISAQSWGLAGSIREVRGSLSEHPAQSRWWETHPESSFAAMLPGNPLASKKSAVGVAQRIALLTPGFGDVLSLITTAAIRSPIDDVLDALAAAWSARRIAHGRAILYGPDGRDVDGFPLGIRI